MKKLVRNTIFRYSWRFLAVLMVAAAFIACDRDDDDDPDPGPPVEDGFYIRGEVTPYSELAFRGQMRPGINEVGQQARTGMYEKYVAINSGSAGFNIVQVAGTQRTEWGPASVDQVQTGGERDQPNLTIQKGTLGTSGVFTVPEAGLYHVIIDTQTNSFIIAPVPFWGILGGATEYGWGDENTRMPLTGSFNTNELNYTIEGLTLRQGEFKFRYGGGWKLEVDGENVKANTNFGGTVSGTLPNLTTTLVPGGDNYQLTSAHDGVYTVNLKWTAEDGFTSSLLRTGDAEELPPYPEELYMIGASVGGWDWATVDLPMIPVHSKPWLFWRIVWIEVGVEDAGFKFAPEKQWGRDFGYDGSDPDNGIYERGTQNMPEPDASGYYMVVVKLDSDRDRMNDSIAVVDPQVFLFGDPVGWEAEQFTVDNENQVITITSELQAGNELRMYAWFDAATGWFTDWWQSEFMIFDGEIEFRGAGGDQERVPVTAGEYTIELDFINNEGTITQN
jgi:hypothetical protein